MDINTLMNEVMEEESSTDDEVEEEDILMLQVSRNETPIYKILVRSV